MSSPLGIIPKISMAFKLQQFSNYGTSTPAVARTVVQGSQLLQPFPIDEHLKKLVTSVLFDLQQHLIRCVSPYELISAEVGEGVKKSSRKVLKRNLKAVL